MKKLYKEIYRYRFEFFFVSVMSILFGSLIVPGKLFDETLMPILLLINLVAGIVLISKHRKLMFVYIVLLVISIFFTGGDMLMRGVGTTIFEYGRLAVYFVFYIIVTFEIISQILRAKFVSKNVIFGLMNGYISLGLVAFFMFLSIELVTPGSFQGVFVTDGDYLERSDSLIYYAFITLMTIGYGDIVPTTVVAQKAAILTGLAGQFYLVIITAVVVEKYIRHRVKKG